MAQIISTKTENKTAQYGRKPKTTAQRPPLFRKMNYILMGVGAIILFAGYIALSGGASEDPNQFSEAIFDTRRLVVAPILILTGLVAEIFAIMYHPCQKAESKETPEPKAE